MHNTKLLTELIHRMQLVVVFWISKFSAIIGLDHLGGVFVCRFDLLLCIT